MRTCSQCVTVTFIVKYIILKNKIGSLLFTSILIAVPAVYIRNKIL